MKRLVALVSVLLLMLIGCGGIPQTSTNNPAQCKSEALINNTSLPDGVLWNQWYTAQKAVAAGGIPLNAVAIAVYGANAITTPADTRAMNVQPCGLVVNSKQDVSAAELNALPHCQHCPYTDPTGIIKCSASPTGYCYAYTNSDGSITVPASKPDATWEFEISILRALGYNTSGM